MNTPSFWAAILSKAVPGLTASPRFLRRFEADEDAVVVGGHSVDGGTGLDCQPAILAQVRGR